MRACGGAGEPSSSASYKPQMTAPLGARGHWSSWTKGLREKDKHGSGPRLLPSEGLGTTAADSRRSWTPSFYRTHSGAGATGLGSVEVGLGRTGRTQNLLVMSAKGTGAEGRTGIPRVLLEAVVAHPREGLLWAGCRWPGAGAHGRGAPAQPPCLENHTPTGTRAGVLGDRLV